MVRQGVGCVEAMPDKGFIQAKGYWGSYEIEGPFQERISGSNENLTPQEGCRA